MNDRSITSKEVSARESREKELTFVVSALAAALDLDDDEQRDALCDLREWAKNRLKAQLPDETPKDGLATLIQRHALTREGALALVREHRFPGESPPLTEETSARPTGWPDTPFSRGEDVPPADEDFNFVPPENGKGDPA